jgi:transcriptional regulator with XRE-family HTH domain
VIAMPERPPTFDPAKFGAWLRKTMDAWDVSVGQLADASGLSRSTISDLRRRTPSAGQRTVTPSINAIAAIAWGLGLPFEFVAGQAGLTRDGPSDRWDLLLTERERACLARALGGEAADLDALLADITTKEAVAHGDD